MSTAITATADVTSTLLKGQMSIASSLELILPQSEARFNVLQFQYLIILAAKDHPPRMFVRMVHHFQWSHETRVASGCYSNAYISTGMRTHIFFIVTD
ncbi:unnamed protein product [Microthlaspi erraticum]|uniref:Uncharacterized protein n=1 Tax=Microthlaspi erraticum TaxID=1685480 RepID=A0A6D2L9R8_9BRAS|nr:unnamed protein product [Microthlaspi erraticum]